LGSVSFKYCPLDISQGLKGLEKKLGSVSFKNCLLDLSQGRKGFEKKEALSL